MNTLKLYYKYFPIIIVVAFQLCYLEWPPNHSMFIFEAEYQIFTKTSSYISNFSHPIILLGFISQIVLVLSAFYSKISNKLINISIILLSLLVLLFLLAGIFSINYKIILSCFPFLSLTFIYFYIKKLS